MRTLAGTLSADQKAYNVDAQVKIVLTKAGQTTYTYTRAEILDIPFHPEQEYSQTAQVILQNADKSLNNINFKGYKGVISYGVGANYSPCAPLWVVHQQFISSPGRLTCELSLAGIPNLLAEHEASADYSAGADPTATLKTLIIWIANAVLACFSQHPSYSIVWDSEDGIIDTHPPKDSFKIAYGETRLEKIKELLAYTSMVMRVEDDEAIHFFVPTTTGVVYDYEYNDIPGAANHTFFVKGLRQALVVPNSVTVESPPDDETPYSGTYTHNDYGILPIWHGKRARVNSDAEALAIAEAMVDRAARAAESGSGLVPMNCGQEVHDYIKITDRRQADSRVGNVGYLNRTWSGKAQTWTLELRFGNVDMVGLLGTMPPQASIPEFKEPQDITDLQESVKDAIKVLFQNQLIMYNKLVSVQKEFTYIPPKLGAGVEPWQIPQSMQGYQHDIVFTSVDQDDISWAAGTIKFYDNTTQAIALGTYTIPDASVRYVYFDLADAAPTVLKVTDNYLNVLTTKTGVVAIIQKGADATVSATIIPSFGKMPLITADIIYLTGLLDKLPDGTYGKVLSTIIAAGLIQVGSGTKDVDLDGFNISDTEIVGQTAGVDQVVLDTDGTIKAGAGKITLDAQALKLWGAKFWFGTDDELYYIQYQIGTTLNAAGATIPIFEPLIVYHWTGSNWEQVAAGAGMYIWHAMLREIDADSNDATDVLFITQNQARDGVVEHTLSPSDGGHGKLGTAGAKWGEVNALVVNGDNLNMITSGTYTGDNTANRAITHGLGGRTPKLVIVVEHYAGANFVHFHIFTGYAAIDYDDGGSDLSFNRGTMSVTDPDTAYFYVGNAASYPFSANGNAKTYRWVAFA